MRPVSPTFGVIWTSKCLQYPFCHIVNKNMRFCSWYHFFGNWSHHYGFYCFWCTFVLIRARVVFSISYWFTGTVLKTVTYPVLLTGLGLFTDFGAALPLNSNLIEVWTKFWFVVFIYSKSQTSKRKRKVL